MAFFFRRASAKQELETEKEREMQGHEEEPPKVRRSVRDRVRYFEGELRPDQEEPTATSDLHEEPNAGVAEKRADVDVPNTREEDCSLQQPDAQLDRVPASEREKAKPRKTDDIKALPKDSEDLVFEPPSPQADDASPSSFLRSAVEKKRREQRAEMDRVAANDSMPRWTASSLLDKVLALRNEIEEEREKNRELLEKIRVARARSDQLAAELDRERDKLYYLQSKRLAQEPQGQDLRSRIRDVKDAYDEKEREATAILRERISQAEGRLEIVEKETQELLRTKRNTERRLKETMAQLDVERARGDSAREENKNEEKQLRSLRCQLNEAQEGLSCEKDRSRKVKQDLEAALEVRTKLQRELRSLRDYSRRPGSATSSLSGHEFPLGPGACEPGDSDSASLRSELLTKSGDP